MNKPSEEEIHAYVDGRLEGARREAVEAWLRANPALGDELRGWREDAHRLRAALAGAPALPDNPRLDPAAIRRKRLQRVRSRLALAASLFVGLGVGGSIGWQAHDAATTEAPMGDALQAYRILVVDRGMRLDVASRQPGAVASWFRQRFADADPLPDLQPAGFRPIGARMFATAQGAAAMVVYEDDNGRAVSLYIRPPGPERRLLPRGRRSEAGLMAHYWSADGYNYALVGRDGDTDARLLRAVSPG